MDDSLLIAVALLAVTGSTVSLILCSRMKEAVHRLTALSLKVPAGSDSGNPARGVAVLLDQLAVARKEFREDLEGLSSFFEKNVQATRVDHERLVTHLAQELESVRDSQRMLLANVQSLSMSAQASNNGSHGPIRPAVVADVMTDEREWEIEREREGLPVSPPFQMEEPYVPGVWADNRVADADASFANHIKSTEES